MKKLAKTLLNQLNTYMNTEVRPLERSIFNYYFNHSSGDDILDSLETFQNSDGGFGNGIEPDFKLIQSSPMATSIGLRYLSKLDNNDRAQKMIARAVEYLETTFDSNRKGWYSVPSNVNEYPHAPWWEFKNDINMTVIDYSWGNPSAELIGYLYKYKEYLNNLDIYSLISYAITNLNERTEFKSEHEIFCYIHMYNTLDKEFSSQIEDVLKLAVSQLVNIKESEWVDYVPTPLKFIEMDSTDFFGIQRKFIDQNLDYLIGKLEEQGKILPTWQWDKYLEEWEISKVEWMGILTLEALFSLCKFNRIMTI
ncbi:MULTISPECIES: hypothetical protein [Clostridium]|uniref:hypothetical protein n=1 Tax=Clostridium TaxID=1485 RepID=UPI0013E97B77|nr:MULTISPECIES: hypothetical protein [Clostridium]MBW9158554.1 hypothetical protein [Clostridium tagluense]MBZ9623812.1 hypothetical protein [Clostridium sp. FP2]MBZ9635204.1 hypothetical protein [Clostridium sp. FP1]WLC63711.1 hypothetical protein KTC93_12520 [Clostridium tagluense]